MNVNLYTTQSLADMAKIKKNSPKLQKPTNDEEKEKFVKQLNDFAKEAKEARKQQLLSSVFGTVNGESSTKEEDGLSKMIKDIRKQRQGIQSRLSRATQEQRKSLQGQMSFMDSQLQSLELKQLEILRAEAGM